MRKVSDPRSRPRGLQVCTLLQERDTDTGCGSGSGSGRVRIIWSDPDRHQGHANPDRHPGHADPDWNQYQANVMFTFFQKISICCQKYLKL
jgi:hypothetical protein